MDKRSNLIAQIKVLQDNLRRTRNTLGSSLDKELITLELHRAINSRVQNLLNKWERKLEQRLQSVDYTSDAHLNIVWEGLQADRKECDAILKEFLSFLGGALIRQNQLDNGICAIADNLLADLSLRSDIPWTRMTILGEGDFFADMTEIIRLSFPEFTIWNLPIVGHEFGHFVGRELRKRMIDRDKRDFLRELIEQEGKIDLSEDKKKKEENYHYEHLADIFATYSLGPAFAFTSILLKFNPNKNKDGESHPSDVKRVYIILKTLQKMEEDSKYKIILSWLKEGWLDVLRIPDQLDPSSLDNRLENLYGILEDEISEVRFTRQNFLRANELSEKLCQCQEDTRDLANQCYTLSEILNAAWICRVEKWSQEDITSIINEKSMALCHLKININCK